MAKEEESPEGKRRELLVFSELLKRGLTLYLPVADVEGVDAIVRTALGKHIELHVRTPESTQAPRKFQVRNLQARDNYYILFLEGSEDPGGDVWVFPSRVFQQHATRLGKGLYKLDLDTCPPKKKLTRAELLRDFKNAWDLFSELV